MSPTEDTLLIVGVIFISQQYSHIIHSVVIFFLALYESTRALKWVAYNISWKENNIGMQYDIQSLPTRPHLLPHPNHAHMLLKHQYPQQVSQLEDEQLRMNFPEAV